MSTAAHKWKVLLDAAAFVPTQPLDLSVYPADFVSISFYKMLGFPTGLGALLVRTPRHRRCQHLDRQLLRAMFASHLHSIEPHPAWACSPAAYSARCHAPLRL